MKPMRHELESRLIARAWRDDQFKEQLLANPKLILEKELGQKIADATKVVALEERADLLYLVLPARPAAGREWTNAELEALACGEAPLPMGAGGPQSRP